MVVYDVETIRPIATGNKKLDSNYQYASGWKDYKGMGISVACFYDYNSDHIFIYKESDFQDVNRLRELQNLLNGVGVISGFNIKKFDNGLLHAHGIEVPMAKCYDLLENLWFAVGLDPHNFDVKTHGGYSLDKVLAVNFRDVQKTMNGYHAPFMWQDGKYNEVIDYCKNDVMVEKALLDRIFQTGGLIDPKSKKFVRMSIPRGF